jgi:hypothetical protein
LAALRSVLALRLRLEDFRLCGGSGSNLSDGGQHLSPMPERDADILKVLICEMAEHQHINLVLNKTIRVLIEHAAVGGRGLAVVAVVVVEFAAAPATLAGLAVGMFTFAVAIGAVAGVDGAHVVLADARRVPIGRGQFSLILLVGVGNGLSAQIAVEHAVTGTIAFYAADAAGIDDQQAVTIGVPESARRIVSPRRPCLFAGHGRCRVQVLRVLTL